MNNIRVVILICAVQNGFWIEECNKKEVICYCTYTWDIVVVANTIRKKSITNFPSKYGRAFSFIIRYPAEKIQDYIFTIFSFHVWA